MNITTITEINDTESGLPKQDQGGGSSITSTDPLPEDTKTTLTEPEMPKGIQEIYSFLRFFGKKLSPSNPKFGIAALLLIITAIIMVLWKDRFFLVAKDRRDNNG